MIEFDYAELVKATQSFSPSNLVGKGSHGSVYKAIFQHNNNNDNNNKLVAAIKKSSLPVNGVDDDHVSIDNFKKLDNEISVLSSLHESPYIINFLGTGHDPVKKKKNNNKVLVMEFMPNGSLHDLLHNNPPPSWPKRVEIAIQIAKAIQFLHEGKRDLVIIHRDIKSSNVLFDSSWNAKLADYGLAVLTKLNSVSHDQPSHQPAGTIGYMDPSYTTPIKLSTKIDVFSYGVVLLEIVSCQKVIDVSRLPSSIVEWAIPLIKKQQLMRICDSRIALPSFMEGTIRHLLHVAARCVSSKEENRPTIRDIVDELMGDYRNCLVNDRVNKIPRWTSLVRSVTLMKRRRKVGGKAKHVKQKCDDISKGKRLLWEILAEIALK